MRKCWVLLICGALLVIPCLAAAIDLNNIHINGFLSQGYMNSSSNNFLADSQNGTFQLNEAGLTITSQIDSKLRLGVQFLSRDLGEEGNNEVLLDWAFADYRYRDWLGIRLGKAKLPIGLYNEGRDSDFLRPMAFLPQSIYDENKRNLLVAAMGAHLYGNIPCGTLGDIDYQAFYGEINFDDDSGQWRAVELNAQQIISKRNQILQSQGSDVRLALDDFDIDNDWVYGASLIYNTPLDGLRFGFSWFEGTSDFDIKVLNLSSGQVTEEDGQDRNKHFWVLSLEYATPLFTIASEYSESQPIKKVMGITISDQTTQSWYGMLTWRVMEQVSLSLLYDVFYADKDDKDGDGFVAKGMPDYYGWRKDLGVGVRYDVNYNWVLKAEYHDVNGASLNLPLYNLPDATQEDWNYYILKASFNF